ncbi:hypothetical protein QUA43_21160 [Microcoleus sp. N9_B4]
MIDFLIEVKDLAKVES